jgi:hypothetical protein
LSSKIPFIVVLAFYPHFPMILMLKSSISMIPSWRGLVPFFFGFAKKKRLCGHVGFEREFFDLN